MALRSRPLKFSLLKATRLQTRSCRSHIERRVADNWDLEKRQSLPLVPIQCATCSPAMEQEPLRKSVEKCQKVNEFDPAHMPFYYRAFQLHPQKDHQIELRHATYNDIIVSTHHHGKQAACDISLENHHIATNASWTENRQCLWPYTTDDILCGTQNVFVKSATMRVDPVVAAEFFKHKLSSTVRCENTPDAKPSKTISVPVQANTTPPCFVSNTAFESGAGTKCFGASDFVYFMEYFMNRTFALEKNDHTECPTTVSRDDVDQHVSSRQAGREIPGVVYYAEVPKVSGAPKNPVPDQNRPSLEQLENMKKYLAEIIPHIFVKRHDYRIYNKDIVFENNYFAKPYVTTGLNNYAIQVAKLRIMAHFRFANVRIHLLKVTVHEEDGSVRIRWRLSGIPQARAFMFWRFLPWRYRQRVDNESEWHDGLSTFYLDGKGSVTKHRMDIVMPEEEVVGKKEPVVPGTLNPGLAA